MDTNKDIEEMDWNHQAAILITMRGWGFLQVDFLWQVKNMT